ncbi:MFS general substrate transporter [Setomelanomma holmii]|uniref:MFS general substrate transporter n=1 Tax=Setomelanomma holmii TaxID=210430 RepID=A0A9P4LR37_9PLEO|nr:MFS general substrate transporter [Setomelanomma holmii]
MEKDEEAAVVCLNSENEGGKKAQEQDSAPFKHTWSLWCIFSVLCLFSFLAALNGTIITTSLPTITGAIGGGSDGVYVWIAQCFIFSSTAPQPLYGQVANIFRRRNPFLAAIMLFAIGSGIAGGATSPTMLIGGRTVQGTSAAGLYVLSDIHICDLVPPRYRGPYLTAVLSTAGIGSTIGPVIGGAMAETHALARIDYLGAIIFIPSTIAIFYALITGGVQQPWLSWRIILPLVLGILSWILYHLQQSFCTNPSTPPHLFTNRTSITGYALVFLSSVVLYIISFFLPIYFQAVKLLSPLLSGVYYLPFALAIIPFAGFSSWALSKWGKYVPLHYAGTALVAIGAGLFATLDSESSRAAWIGFQIIPSAGIAMIYTAALPSTLAPLKEADVAMNARLGLVKDEGLRESLKDGAAYAFAAGGTGLRGIADSENLIQVIQVYARALKAVWLVVMAVGILAFVLVPLQRSIELKKIIIPILG